MAILAQFKHCNHLIRLRFRTLIAIYLVSTFAFQTLAVNTLFSSICEQSFSFESKLQEIPIGKELKSQVLIELLARIDSETKHIENRVAAFDFDGTIFPYDIGAMVREYFVNNPKHSFARSIDPETFWNDLDDKKEDFAPHQAMILAGYTEEEINNIVRNHFFRNGLPLFSELVIFIEELKKRNIKVLIVSASPQPVLRALSRHLGLPRGQILGTDVKLSEAGHFLPLVNGIVSNGPQKIHKLQENIAENESLILAAGNTTWDKELLLRSRFGLSIRSANVDHNHYLSELKLSILSNSNSWAIYYPETISYIKSDL